MKLSNETKVGILATVAIILMILGINYLKGKNVFSKNMVLYSKFEDVDGLNSSNPVLLYGVKVGQIDELRLISEGRKKVLVRFHLEGDLKLPRNTLARIISSDLLGSKAVNLLPGNNAAIVRKYDTIPGEVELSVSESISKVVAPVKQKVETLLGSMDTVVTALNDVFNEGTKNNLRSSFNSVKVALSNIEKTTGDMGKFVSGETTRLHSILTNVDRISSNLEKNDALISRAISNFSAISDSLRAAHLKKAITETNEAAANLNQILKKVQQGEGSLGALVNDDRLYKNLRDASSHLDLLISDIKAHPHQYLNFSIWGGSKKTSRRDSVKIQNSQAKN